MRKLLTILFILITAGAWAQSGTTPAPNPNSIPIAFETIAQAIKGTKSENWKITVNDSITGGNFTVKRRIKGYKPNGGTIIAMADSASVLVRDISQSRGIKLKWFLKGDGVTDNAAKMNWLVSSASPFNHFIIEKGDNFFCSQTINVQKAILIDGPDGSEAINTAFFTFPQAVSGFVFNNAASAGSFPKGFAVTSTIPESGKILEYNSTNGTMLYIAPITTLTAGKTFEFRDSYFPDKVKGTAVISNPGTANIVYAISYTLPSGTFQIGDTVKGSTSNAKAVVRFVSRNFNALAVGVITGTFAANETITGTASGTTAKFVSVPLPARWGFAKVATVSNVTGSLNGVTDSTAIDSTNYATSGTLDSVGASGKRTNIFVEAGKGNSVGITINRRIELEDITVYGFGSDGILITNITTPVSNANLTRLNKVRSNANAGNAIRGNGGDANHITLSNSTGVNNCGWGLCDITFLGMGDIMNHFSVNMVGGRSSGTYINRKTLYDNPYTEGAYSGMAPWQSAENIMGGGSVKIGGTDGLPNNVPYWSTSGNGGAALSVDELRNNNIYTTPGTTNKSIVFKGTGVNPVPLWAEAQGQAGNGRGAAIGFRTPYGAGYQRADIRNVAMDMGYILGMQTATGYGFQFFMRKSIPPAITITTSNGRGKGAVLQADIKGGKIVAINVLAGGQSYPINGSTLSIPNASGTTLNPLIEDSVFVGVQVRGDSLYTGKDDDIAPIVQMGSDSAFIPMATGTGSLGTSAYHWKDLWADNIHTNVTSSIPTRLIAQDLGGATALEMLSLKATGNPGIGRGSLAGFTTPGGTGIATEIVQIGGIWGANSHGTLVFNVGDDSASMVEKMRISSTGNVGIGTITPQDVLEIAKNVGGTVGSLRFGGTFGRSIGSYSNGASAVLDLIATSISVHGNLGIDQQKQIQFNNYAGSSSNYGIIAVGSSNTMDFVVNSNVAQSIASTGRTLYGAPINPKSYTVATLPTGNQGDIAIVTDALSPVNGATVAGGGAVKVPVFSNGTNWIAMAAATASSARTLTVTATATLALSYSIDYVYTGTVDANWTLPAVNTNTGSAYTIRIFNKSTHNLYINSNAGGSDIFSSGGGGGTPLLILASGASAHLLPDGTSFDDIK